MSSLLNTKDKKEVEDKPVLARGAELTARGRLEQLFDAGTFMELDKNIHHRSRSFGMDKREIPGDGVVCGFGEVNGQTVYAYSQDRNVLGGSLGEAHAQKNRGHQKCQQRGPIQVGFRAKYRKNAPATKSYQSGPQDRAF